MRVEGRETAATPSTNRNHATEMGPPRSRRGGVCDVASVLQLYTTQLRIHTSYHAFQLLSDRISRPHIKVLSEYCRAVGPRRELDSMARAKYIGIVLASVTLLRVAVANEAEPRALQTCLKSGVEFGFPGTAGSDDIFLSWSMFWTRISHSPDVRNSSLCSRAHSLSSGWSALYL